MQSDEVEVVGAHPIQEIENPYEPYLSCALFNYICFIFAKSQQLSPQGTSLYSKNPIII